MKKIKAILTFFSIFMLFSLPACSNSSPKDATTDSKKKASVKSYDENHLSHQCNSSLNNSIIYGKVIFL